MASKLGSNHTIHVLAHDLGLRGSGDPVDRIVQYCRKRIRAFLRDFGDCTTTSGLLDLAANSLGTRFAEVRDDGELQALISTYMERRELGFAALNSELTPDVFGITLRLLRPSHFELQYVSVIDCRGEKAYRSYFTKWHELGHLLILTDQCRLAFKRTHSLHDWKSPEEALVDVIAGEFAYYAPMVTPHADGRISFEKIEAIRDLLCPEGSLTSALIGISKAWPHPCLLVEARLSHKKGDGDPSQGLLCFAEPRPKALRAVRVMVNDAARERKLFIPRNFRVPQESVIWRVFHEDPTGDEAVENLDWWTSSDGSQLASMGVNVCARYSGESVYALISPYEQA